jgi:uncharacterized protein
VTVQHLPQADYQRARWANDGGWTSEIARAPERGSDFDWRLSKADVDADGPFSRFGGYARELIVLSGGVRLTFADPHEIVELAGPLDRYRFDGDRAVRAEVMSAPMRDLNIIWRPDRMNVEVRTIELAGVMEIKMPPPNATLLLYVASGWFHVDASNSRLRVNRGDTLCVEGNFDDRWLTADGTAQLIAVAIEPA